MDKRRSYGRLISTMGFAILVRRHLYIESAPGSHKATLLITGALNYILVSGWPIRVTWPNVTTVAIKQIAIFLFFFIEPFTVHIDKTFGHKVMIKTSSLFLILTELFTNLVDWLRWCLEYLFVHGFLFKTWFGACQFISQGRYIAWL